ncbi:hypothetical protein KAU11_00710, partial [Candidatus Babeliales bacterium]|nr:hypothetical protein [Candidatus Babeliales bacterium]
MVAYRNVLGSKTNLSISNIIRLAWPTILSNAVLLIVCLVDLYFVGKIGTNAIVAVSLAVVTWWTIANFFEGLRHGTIILAARLFGEGKHDKISQVLNSGIFFSVIFGIILALLAGPITRLVYKYMTQNDEVRRLGIEYLPVILYSAISVFFFYVVEGFLRGLKSVLLPTILS